MGGEIHVRSKLSRNVAVSAVVGSFNYFFLGEVGGDNIWVGYGSAGLMVRLGSLLIYFLFSAIISSSIFVSLSVTNQGKVIIIISTYQLFYLESSH